MTTTSMPPLATEKWWTDKNVAIVTGGETLTTTRMLSFVQCHSFAAGATFFRCCCLEILDRLDGLLGV